MLFLWSLQQLYQPGRTLDHAGLFVLQVSILRSVERVLVHHVLHSTPAVYVRSAKFPVSLTALHLSLVAVIDGCVPAAVQALVSLAFVGSRCRHVVRAPAAVLFALHAFSCIDGTLEAILGCVHVGMTL
jgi:hypothetical protein